MKSEFANEYLRCPECRQDRTLSLAQHQTDKREVREGTLRCSACRADFPVHRGVGHLMHAPPEHVLKEAAGLERFAEYMRADGWDRELVRKLPNVEHGYWYVQARSIQQLEQEIPLRPDEWLLDVGSNTCWATNRFAERGLNAIALDISTAELQGLHTADYFIEEGTSYFERILGSMNDIPLASNSLDYVYCCEVLHHNDPVGLRRTFGEIYRVLKPGGQLLVINETLKTWRDRIGVHTEGVEQFEGYEHAHWALQYRWEALRAGFRTRLMAPSYHWFFEVLPPGAKPPFRRVRSRLKVELQSHRLSRAAYLAWLNHYAGGVQFNMIATKPAGAIGSRLRAALSG